MCAPGFPDDGGCTVFGHGNQSDAEVAERCLLADALRNFLWKSNEGQMGEDSIPRRLLDGPLPL
jgi:hypothetical protein